MSLLDWRGLRDSALKQAMRVLSDPRFGKLMSDPRVMSMVMKTLALRGTVEAAVDDKARAIAGRLQLATRDEVAGLKGRVRELEALLDKLRRSPSSAR